MAKSKCGGTSRSLGDTNNVMSGGANGDIRGVPSSTTTSGGDITDEDLLGTDILLRGLTDIYTNTATHIGGLATAPSGSGQQVISLPSSPGAGIMVSQNSCGTSSVPFVATRSLIPGALLLPTENQVPATSKTTTSLFQPQQNQPATTSFATPLAPPPPPVRARHGSNNNAHVATNMLPGNRGNSVIIASGVGGSYSRATSNIATSYQHPCTSAYGNSNGGNHGNHRGCNVIFANKSGNGAVNNSVGGNIASSSSGSFTTSNDETSNNMFLEFLAASTAEQEMKDEEKPATSSFGNQGSPEFIILNQDQSPTENPQQTFQIQNFSQTELPNLVQVNTNPSVLSVVGSGNNQARIQDVPGLGIPTSGSEVLPPVVFTTSNLSPANKVTPVVSPVATPTRQTRDGNIVTSTFPTTLEQRTIIKGVRSLNKPGASMAGPSIGSTMINNTQQAPTTSTSPGTGGGGRERAAVISEILANLGTPPGQIQQQQQLIGPPILHAVNSQASVAGQISSPDIGGQISAGGATTSGHGGAGIQFRGAISDHMSGQIGGGQIKQEGLSQPPTPKTAMSAATEAETEVEQNLTSHQTLVPSLMDVESLGIIQTILNLESISPQTGTTDNALLAANNNATNTNGGNFVTSGDGQGGANFGQPAAPQAPTVFDQHQTVKVDSFSPMPSDQTILPANSVYIDQNTGLDRKPVFNVPTTLAAAAVGIGNTTVVHQASYGTNVSDQKHISIGGTPGTTTEPSPGGSITVWKKEECSPRGTPRPSPSATPPPLQVDCTSVRGGGANTGAAGTEQRSFKRSGRSTPTGKRSRPQTPSNNYQSDGEMSDSGGSIVYRDRKGSGSGRNSSNTTSQETKPNNNFEEKEDEDKYMKRKRQGEGSEQGGGTGGARKESGGGRRDPIKQMLEQLQSNIPHIGDPHEEKVSHAGLLLEGSDYIRSLMRENNTLEENIEAMKTKIESLNKEIEDAQEKLPEHGSQSIHKILSTKGKSIPDMFADHVRQRTQNDWRYWVFTSIMGHFVHTFAQEVSNISPREMERTSLEWLQERMSLQQLRKDAFRKLAKLCSKTSIMEDPTRLPEEARGFVALPTSDPGTKEETEELDPPAFRNKY